jgi:hypothetical protein
MLRSYYDSIMLKGKILIKYVFWEEVYLGGIKSARVGFN